MSTPIFFRYFENIELRLGGVIELFEKVEYNTSIVVIGQ